MTAFAEGNLVVLKNDYDSPRTVRKIVDASDDFVTIEEANGDKWDCWDLNNLELVSEEDHVLEVQEEEKTPELNLTSIEAIHEAIAALYKQLFQHWFMHHDKYVEFKIEAQSYGSDKDFELHCIASCGYNEPRVDSDTISRSMEILSRRVGENENHKPRKIPFFKVKE